MPHLLVEIGCEELPPSFQRPAAERLCEGLLALLDDARIAHGDAQPFSTPRRLAVLVVDVAERGEPSTSLKRGPPWASAFDADGKPTAAASGFARSCGVAVGDLVREEEGGKVYAAARVSAPGVPLVALLTSRLAGVLRALSAGGRTMRWKEEPHAFVRPVRRLVVLYGEEVVPCEAFGLTAGRESRKARSWGDSPVVLADAAGYESALEEAGVVPHRDKRWLRIEKRAQSATPEGTALAHDGALLDEVTDMVERGVAVLGAVEERFLRELPPEVVVQAMRAHQRYFAVRRGGELAPHFVAVLDCAPKAASDAVKTCEAVLAARISDALFHYRRDVELGIDAMAERLGGVLWFGHRTLADRADMAGKVALRLAATLKGLGDVDEAALAEVARLYLADLASELIRDGKEFVPLQGVVGYYYALASGKAEEIAKAVRETCWPQTRLDLRGESGAREGREGSLLSLADKLVFLAEGVRRGFKPTAYGDPLALKGVATAAFLVVYGGLWGLTRAVVEDALSAAFGKRASRATAAFLVVRAERFMVEHRDVPVRVARCVMASPDGDVLGWFQRAEALVKVSKEQPEVYERAVTVAKRLNNILRGQKRLPALHRDALSEPELALLRETESVGRAVGEALERRDFALAVSELCALAEPLDAFFDAVFVMDEDVRVRRNRLALLAEAKRLFDAFGDFSAL